MRCCYALPMSLLVAAMSRIVGLFLKCRYCRRRGAAIQVERTGSHWIWRCRWCLTSRRSGRRIKRESGRVRAPRPSAQPLRAIDVPTCPLCNEPATVEALLDHMTTWAVTCSRCTHYTIDDDLRRAVERAREQRDEALLTLLPWLSLRATEATAAGGRSNFSVESFMDVVDDVRRRRERVG